MENSQNKLFGRFLIVWVGQLISSIGSGLTAFSLGTYAYQKTHTASSFALVTLCTFLPAILLSPIGGVLADRFDRRVMMILGDLGSALGLVLILIIMLTGNIELWQIYIGAAISSVFAALQGPAYKASVTDLLTEDQFSKASGLVQLASSSKFLISPIISGLLLSITGIATVLTIDISTFAIAILAVFFIKKDLQIVDKNYESQHFMKNLAEGWDAIASNRGVVFLIMIISIVTFFIGFLQTLFGPLVLSFSDSKTLGIAQSISAIGMLLSSLYIGIFSKTERYADMVIIGLSFSGLFFSLIGLTSNIYFIVVAAFLFFYALSFVNTGCDVLVRKNIDNDKQGRVWGIIAVLSQLGSVVAYCVAGFLADHIFNPLLNKGGFLVPTVGKIIGTGQGRGIGLLFIISGAFVVILAFITSRFKSIRALVNN
ncbi:MFS transporter [Clostridium estertheticum]|uniref:MFS transporter n=1 Tax=Clostridium estertheticum TaxID=238834 RepID=UPI001C7D0F99|nr:MFS transporter [Clostridium estertheticum]MBX4265561.1 MFS transporter [Clostridium estertheticum]MBX4271922.1 MFS transporter [Clostridium estertheticum]WLC82095.1 MFS transporter [Clostridium estertheticum]WLC91093.1 MFS transporter [Clostridium estertheticum]